ncbi:MAG: lysophospholipid acyltransferase family protein [Chloroflexota bacterium]
METQDFDPRDRKQYYYSDTPFRRTVVALLTVLSRPFMKLKVNGLEHLPSEGAVVLVANHVTTFDVFPMQISLPRPIFYMGKAELFRNGLVDAVFRRMGAFPVYRGEKDAWAMRHAARILEHGQALGMFPEGTRSRGRGLGVAKTGAARLAIDARCPVVPMALVGSDRFFRQLPRPNTVTVSLLPPIVPTADDTPLSLTDRVMFSLASALPLDMRGVYSELPKGFKIQ